MQQLISVKIEELLNTKIKEALMAFYQEKEITEEFTIEDIGFIEKNGIFEFDLTIISGRVFQFNSKGKFYVKLKESPMILEYYDFIISEMKMKFDNPTEAFQIIDVGKIASPLSLRQKPFVLELSKS